MASEYKTVSTTVLVFATLTLDVIRPVITPIPVQHMQTLIDFLEFRLFISPYVLIIFYYLGALGVPVASWLLVLWLARRHALFGAALDKGRQTVFAVTSRKNRGLMIMVFVLLFAFMEIIWRMMFEFLLAYLQIRDVLLATGQV